MITTDVVVLLFGGRRLPGPLAGLDTQRADGSDDIDAAAGRCGRLIVVGSDADLAAVLTRLLRAERLDVEVGYVAGRLTARRARRGTARRVPLIRDETGHVIVGVAEWRGEVAAVRIEPTRTLPGLRATVSGGGRPRWLVGRAVQLGTTSAVVTRDGVPAARSVRRSTFYRHTQGWLLVR